MNQGWKTGRNGCLRADGQPRSHSMKTTPRKSTGILCFVILTGLISLSFSVDAAENTLVINADIGKAKINKNIYGHFSEHLGHCIYGGYWVGEDSNIPNTHGIRNDVVKALRRIKVPVLRWPGGCFADEYHWKDGIGPRGVRPTMINTHWGGVTENNHFGTHEFLELCKQLGAEPFITGNVGSGTVEEMADWVEYVNFGGVSPMADLRRENGRDEPWEVKFWGIGNENWGCGGNMVAEHYADVYRRFQTYVREYNGTQPYKIACGPYADDYEWMEVLMKNVGPDMMQGIDFHYYCGSGEESHSATEFNEIDWFHQLRRALLMDEHLTMQSAIMDRYDPQKSVNLVVGEWGAWHDEEPGSHRGFLYQQNSLRDALVAGIHFNILHKHCDRVRMANIAQTVNVLQAMILTDKEKMILTPTYHVFDMFKVHQDATLLPSDLETTRYKFDGQSIPTLTASASGDESGKIHISICNLDPNSSAKLECVVRGADCNKVTGTVLTADKINACNTFDKPEGVKPAGFDDFKLNGGKLTVDVPSKSIMVLEIV